RRGLPLRTGRVGAGLASATPATSFPSRAFNGFVTCPGSDGESSRPAGAGTGELSRCGSPSRTGSVVFVSLIVRRWRQAPRKGRGIDRNAPEGLATLGAGA